MIDRTIDGIQHNENVARASASLTCSNWAAHVGLILAG
jgi:hypothetical protein